MEIYQLRTFVTIAKLGHLTRAAERLHLTQPAVSGHIKSLEQEFGLALFQRSHNGMVLTKEGELLLPEAEKTLSAVTGLTARARAIQGELTGKVCLGILPEPELIRIGPFTSGLLQMNPLLDLDVPCGLSGWVLEGICSAELDAGYFIGTNTGPHVSAFELCKLTYRVVAPPQRREEIHHAGWRHIASLPWIGMSPQCAVTHLTREMFREQGLETRHAIETDGVTSTLSLVSSGVGLCLMREDVALAAAQDGQLVVWEHGKACTSLSFVYASQREHDPLLVAMLSVLRHVWRAPD